MCDSSLSGTAEWWVFEVETSLVPRRDGNVFGDTGLGLEREDSGDRKEVHKKSPEPNLNKWGLHQKGPSTFLDGVST